MQGTVDRFVGKFGLIALMTLAWLGFSGSVTLRGIAAGFAVSLMISTLVRSLYREPYRIRVDLVFAGCFLVYLRNVLVNIFRSAAAVVPVVLRRSDRPIQFRVHLSTDDPLIVTLISNAITLTPGTITLDAGDDNVLTVISLVDDGQNGRLLEAEILRNFSYPFHKVLYRGDAR